ncbi:hypothetical protein HK097_007621 [Rhizophlyctis rosea]|uniref:Myosin heavy chain n=1 Tax=Rhizophlyctis rosea TaxID=64517 RepID=A0AAD5X1I9_9FUNG|nr:hypothetical protein HK097_007621 [Rhizophlyctis rosea]
MTSLTERIKPDLAADALAQSQWAEKKWTWVKDKDEGFIAGWVTGEKDDTLSVELTNGQKKRDVNVNDTEKMNPPKFDKVEDMADLTHLNEASVVHNLRLRYLSNLIYTYSGLFLVAVNPYKRLPIYTDDIVKAYKGRKRQEMAPHIFAISDAAYFDMLQSKENQSILITGESGAGKTENTKKVIQYLASTASISGGGKGLGTLEQQILQANPILESFGNAQTIRNNNSSRFGKFIRIEFNAAGQIAGANIDWYLLEKSRVTHQTSKERNYHIFYQFLKGAPQEVKDRFLVDGSVNDYRFIKNSNKNIDGVDDAADFKALQDALQIMQFTEEDQQDLLRSVAAILHLGNITVQNDREDQAQLSGPSQSVCEKVCHVLGIPAAEFVKALLKPKIKAGRDWVTQARNVEQVLYSVEALSRSLYERMFGKLVDKINGTMHTSGSKSGFIGVLDIAGFEIFEKNSFEQLCINYTNEKLQQFFNHHMFILEQEEYRREGIEWKFIDFGLDLQPTIDLIEKTQPIGVLSCLDEECVMPKATDKTFIEKLNSLWKGKSNKYEVPRFNQGFILSHYAGKVEYSTDGWLDKNKDPLNENVTRLLAGSSHKYIADLFSEYLGEGEDTSKARVVGAIKKGAFRTVAQRHKEQLNALMTHLYSTEPHFVRCIIPNEEKKPAKIQVPLVLDQLRCNGVLEGIRICRAGFPNRLPFADFRQRYELLAPGVIPKGYMDGRQAAQKLLEEIQLDVSQYRIGSSKVFFRAGVLAELEDRRDIKLSKIVQRIQALMRGFLARKAYRKLTEKSRAIKIIQRNARIYVTLREWPWWKLYTKVKPLLNVSRTDEELKKREELAKEWEEKYKKEAEERMKMEAARAAHEIERGKLEELLIQEKNAAANQAEILARIQEREQALEERLKEASGDLEDKEAQNEELGKAKKRLEGDLKGLRQQLEDEKANLERLEKDKAIRELRVKELEDELRTEGARASKLESDKKSLEGQLSELQQQLDGAGASEADLARQKNKLQATIAELEQKLAEEQEERAKLEQRRTALEAELRTARDTISELERVRSELESVVKRREAEVEDLNQRLKQESAEKDNIDKQRRDLQVKLNSTQTELDTERSERDKLAKQKKRTEEELEQLHHLMEEKGTEQNKQAELRKMRENEVSDLRTQLLGAQSDLEETRKRTQAQIDKLKLDLDTVQQEGANLQRGKAVLEKQIADLKDDLERSEEGRTRGEKSRRQLESDLADLRAQLEGTDAGLSDVRSQKDALERQISALNSRLEESETNNARLEREKQNLQKHADSLRDDLEEEARKRSALETQKKKIAVEVADLQARLDEEEASKSDLQKKLAAKGIELDGLKDRYNKDVAGRTAELEEGKKKVEKDLADLQQRFDEVDRNVTNLEKTRARLTAETEDLKLEVEREHNATRNAERLLKQVESQLNTTNLSLESERKQRDLAESQCRKLQATIEGIQTELDEKLHQIGVIQKGKDQLEGELQALIDEVGGGGKNIHDMERNQRKLQARIDELQTQLDDAENLRISIEEAKTLAEIELRDYRRQAERDLAAKDTQMDETRRMLMKEVNSLGDSVEELKQQNSEHVKVRHNLEAQMADLMSRAESTAKGQSDLQKVKAKNEAALRELQMRLEEEERARRNFEELSQRHEKKANTYQTEIDRLETQLEDAVRAKKGLEKRVEELTHELEGGVESKSALAEAKKRLERELADVRERLEETEDSLAALQKKASSAADDEFSRNAKRLLEDKIEELDAGKRAAIAAARLKEAENEERVKEVQNLEKQKKVLQTDLEALKMKLEEETVAKGEEAAARRKLGAELKEALLKLDAENAKARDLADALEMYRQKADQALNKLEAADLARIKAEKGESFWKIQVNELEQSLTDATNHQRLAEDRIRTLEEQLLDFQEKLEEDSHELADLQVAKRKLQDELETVQERNRKDNEDREGVIENLRKKYQKELKQFMTELEIEKSNVVQLKGQNKELEVEVEAIMGKFEAESRAAVGWAKEKERLEAKLEDMNRQMHELLGSQDESQNQMAHLNTQIRELRGELEEAQNNAQILGKAKRSLEARIDEMNDKYGDANKSKLDMQRSYAMLEDESSHLRDEIDNYQEQIRAANDRAKRAEQLYGDQQTELHKTRDTLLIHEKEKVTLEKQIKELNVRIVDLESSALSRDAASTKRLEGRMEELAAQLDAETREKNEAIKNVRKAERVVRDLQFQLQERDKAKGRFEEEMEKMEGRLKRMKGQVEDLESSESELQLAKRKLEREVAEYKERAYRLEKENEKLKKVDLSSMSRMDRTASREYTAQ